jgi:hypothetical protein
LGASALPADTTVSLKIQNRFHRKARKKGETHNYRSASTSAVLSTSVAFLPLQGTGIDCPAGQQGSGTGHLARIPDFF